MHEFHVIGDGGDGGVDDLVRAAETAEDVGGHFCAELVVAVEADAAFCGVAGPCGWFGDVVEEDGEDERRRDDVGEEREHESGVGPDIAFRVVFGWLGAAFEGFHFGEEDLEETGGVEEIEAADPVRVEHDPEELVADAFDADGVEGVCLGADGVPCGWVDGVVEGGGEADGAEEAEPVFGEAEGGVSDGAETAVFEVIAAADEIDDVAGERVEEHAVDGEVAAFGVGFRGGEDDVVWAAAVEVGTVGAERGDFEEVAVEVDDDDAEVCADELGAREEGEDLVRGGAGGDVVVVGLAAEEFVADAAAGEVGGVAGVGEPFCQIGGGAAEAQRVGCGVHGGNAGTELVEGKAAARGCGRGVSVRGDRT